MDKKDVHTNISQLLEKIEILNTSLSKSKHLHKIECELMKTYSDELNVSINELENFVKRSAQPVLENQSSLGTDKKANQIKSEDLPKETAKTGLPKNDSSIENDKPVYEKIESKSTAPKPVDPNKEDETISSDKKDDKANAIEMSKESSQADKEQSSTKDNKTDVMDSQVKIKGGKDDDRDSGANPVSLNDKFSTTSIELSDMLRNQPVEDLRACMDFAEKYLFATELWDGDVDGFEKSIRKLNDCKGIDEAISFLETEIRPHYQWDGKDEIIDQFIKLLSRKFN